MKSCWKSEPIERPGFSELVERIDQLKDELRAQDKKMAITKKQSAAYLQVYS